jgi:hypothetical protein
MADNPLLKALKKSSLPINSDDEATESMLGRVGNVALSGLARVANVLDLPGSSVRDFIAGENPFDQWIPGNLSTGEHRTSGRDLAQQFGLAGKQKTWGNFFGGLALEIGTDPLTYTGAGGLLKAAVTGSLKGAKAGSGLLRVGIPLVKSSSTEILTGSLSRAAASGIDSVAGKVAQSAPVRLGRTFLDSSVMGRITPTGQAVAENLFDAQGKAQAGVLGLTNKLARSLETSGAATVQGGVDLRRQLELPHLGTSPQAAELSGAFALSKAASDSLGLPANELFDELHIPGGGTAKLGYSPRQLNETLRRSKQAERVGGPLAATSSRDKARLQVLKGFAEGTDGVNEFFANPTLKATVGNWTSLYEAERSAGKTAKELAKIKKDALTDISQHIGQNWSNKIQQHFQPEKGAKKLWVDPTGKKKIWAKVAPQGYTPSLKDRHKDLASLAFDNEGWLDNPIFPNHPIVDAEQYLLSTANRQEAATKLYDTLAKIAKPASSDMKDTVSVGKIIKSLGFKSKAATDQLAQRLGVPVTKTTATELARMRVSKDVADDLLGLWPTYQAPRETGMLLNTVDSFQALFKAGVLTWPARFVRDAMSGAVRNIENGWLDPKAFVDTHNLIQGRTVKGLKTIPVVRTWLANNNLPINDANATEAVRQLYAQYSSSGHAATDVVAAAMPSVDPSLESILGRIPGRVPTTEAQSVANVASMVAGRAPGTDLNPLHVRGVNGRMRNEFGPTVAGDAVGKYTDTLNRMSPFLYKLRNGEDPARAMAEITRAQVDYSSRAFTPHERQLKRLFPFYSFTKSQVGYVASELLNNPGGRLRQSIRATSDARGDDATTPDYIGGTTSIPLGEQPDGSKRFLTGLGLMHEDPLSFAGGPQSMLLELASRMNPLVKAPMEYMAGQSFFQTGTDGGRPLDELDPTVGRTASNLLGLKKPVEFPGSRELEMIAMNSPLSRVLTTARQLSDPRKGVTEKAVNLMSGVRISDVGPNVQDAVLRDRSVDLMKQLGARAFEKTYFGDDELAALPAPQRALAEKLTQLQSLLAERAKERRVAANR